MPDVLHWLGIRKINKFISMSDEKYDAVINSGIKIVNRISLPDRLIPSDARVEIDAKIAHGYFTDKEKPTEKDLIEAKGREWDDHKNNDDNEEEEDKKDDGKEDKKEGK